MWMERKIGWGLSAQQKGPGENNPVSGYLQGVHTLLLLEAAERFPTARKQWLIREQHCRATKNDLGELKGSSWQPQKQLKETVLNKCLHNELGQSGICSNANSSTNIQREKPGHAEVLKGVKK